MTEAQARREIRARRGEFWRRDETLNGNKTYRVCCLEGFNAHAIYTLSDIERRLSGAETDWRQSIREGAEK